MEQINAYYQKLVYSMNFDAIQVFTTLKRRPSINWHTRHRAILEKEWASWQEFWSPPCLLLHFLWYQAEPTSEIRRTAWRPSIPPHWYFSSGTLQKLHMLQLCVRKEMNIYTELCQLSELQSRWKINPVLSKKLSSQGVQVLWNYWSGCCWCSRTQAAAKPPNLK